MKKVRDWMEWVGHVSKKLSFYVSEFAMHFMFHFVSISFFIFDCFPAIWLHAETTI